MEEYAIKQKINTIKANAIRAALPFYKATGWVETGKLTGVRQPIKKSMGIKKKVQVKKTLKKPIKKIPKKSGFFNRIMSIFG